MSIVQKPLVTNDNYMWIDDLPLLKDVRHISSQLSDEKSLLLMIAYNKNLVLSKKKCT